MAIIIYALGAGKYPALFDSSGSDITNTKKYWPAAHFGKIETVAVRPVKDDFIPYTKAELDEFISFDFGMDKDWDTNTVPPIRTISGFSVQEITVIIVEADPDNGIAEESITFAQIVFTVDYGTDEAKAALAASPSLDLGAELNGFREGKTRPGLIIQFPHLLLGRRLESGTGTPNPVGDGTYSSAQVDALLAGYSKSYPPIGPLTFTKADVDSGTKLLSVSHGLGQKWGLSVTTGSENLGGQMKFDKIIPVDDNNLNIDCTEWYDDMTGNYYLRIRK